MTDIIRRHKFATVFAAAALLILLIVVFAGRRIAYAAIDFASGIRSRDKSVCTVCPDNATQIVYNGTTYQILNKKADQADIGAWTGVIRKTAVLGDQYHVLKQAKSQVDWKAQMQKLKNTMPDGGKTIVTYFNVFSLKNNDQSDMVAVDLSGGFYQAVPVEKQDGRESLIFSGDNCELSLDGLE